MALQLPGEYTFGFVTGRIIQAVADSPADEDRFPEARAATGEIQFKPSVELRKSSNHYHAFVGFSTVITKLDKLGRLVDDQTWKDIQDGEITGDDLDGPHGIWLVTGTYLVTPSVTGARIAPFTVEVTADHTEANPLDLVTAAPPQPAPGVTLMTLLVPPGGGPNDTLVRDAGGNLVWSSVAYDSAQDAQGALAQIPATISSEIDVQLPVAVAAQVDESGVKLLSPGLYESSYLQAQALEAITEQNDGATKVTLGGVVIYYNSGWRDISGILVNGWTGNVYGRRVGNVIELRFFNMDSSNSTSHTCVTSPPAMFRTLGGPIVGAASDNPGGSGSSSGVLVSAGSQNQIWRMPPGAQAASATYTTDQPIPASLPGLPV